MPIYDLVFPDERSEDPEMAETEASPSILEAHRFRVRRWRPGKTELASCEVNSPTWDAL